MCLQLSPFFFVYLLSGEASKDQKEADAEDRKEERFQERCAAVEVKWALDCCVNKKSTSVPATSC